MNKRLWVGVLGLALGAALPLRAQLIPSSGGGSATTPTANGQIFTPMQVGPYSGSGVSRLNQGIKNLFSWLPSLSPMTGGTGLPTSTFPTQSQMPGMNYLQQFGYRVATPAQ
jgi:hypothetical protein